jgi:hypothetical protein
LGTRGVVTLLIPSLVTVDSRMALVGDLLLKLARTGCVGTH